MELELADLKAVAEERGRFLEITSSALRRLSDEADRRKAVAEELQRVAEERLAVIERLQVELERSLLASEESQRLRAALVTHDEALRETQRAAEERLVVIERLSADLERSLASSSELETLRAAIAKKDAELAERSKVIEDLSRTASDRLTGMREIETALSKMREEAEKRAVVLADMSDVLERQDREIERLRKRK